MQGAARPSFNVKVALKYGSPPDVIEDPRDFFRDRLELGGRADLETGQELAIYLGRSTTEENLNDLLAHLKDANIVLNIARVSLTVDKVVWTTDWQRTIQDHLPRNVTTITTVYDNDKRIQKSILLCDDERASPIIFASLPIDVLQESDAIDLLHHSNLQALILLPPLDGVAFMQNDLGFQDELIRILRNARGLRKIRVPLDFSLGMKEIISALQDIDGLTTLELEKPSSFDISKLPSNLGLRLENALLTSLEPFPRLQNLIFDRDILTVRLFDMAKRMFDQMTDSKDPTRVIFYSPRLSFHEIPTYLL